MDKHAAHQEMENRIIFWHNCHRPTPGGYFDCGSLGILHLYWMRSQWQTEWIILSPSPVPIAEVTDA